MNDSQATRFANVNDLCVCFEMSKNIYLLFYCSLSEICSAPISDANIWSRWETVHLIYLKDDLYQTMTIYGSSWVSTVGLIYCRLNKTASSINILS